jgi:L-cysteine desulfidase
VWFSEYLATDWRPALGCTEPASVALAAASAATLLSAPAAAVHLICDPRTYKNCRAVGLPHSGSRAGVRWAVALGAVVRDPSLGFGVFGGLDEMALARAGDLVAAGAVAVNVDPERQTLHIDCTVRSLQGSARTVIVGDHTRLVQLERDGQAVPIAPGRVAADPVPVRRRLAGCSLAGLLRMAATVTDRDRQELLTGAELNAKMAHHGLSLFPPGFVGTAGQDLQASVPRLTCAGVYARMSGEPLPVMTLAG